MNYCTGIICGWKEQRFADSVAPLQQIAWSDLNSKARHRNTFQTTNFQQKLSMIIIRRYSALADTPGSSII